MKILTIIVGLILCMSLITAASALSEQELRNQFTILKNTKSTVDFNQFTKTKQNEYPISEQSKQIAIQEVMQKAQETKEDSIPIILWIKKDYDTKKVINRLEGFEIKYIYDQLNGVSGKISKEALTNLGKNKAIDYFVYDSIIKSNLMQSRPLIQADIVESNYSLTGQGIGVCHLDTGINYNHTNLVGAYVGGYDFINNDNDPFDDSINGHGTLTAGVIASNHATRRGMAPGVDLLSVKVLDSNGLGQFSDLIAGINWCISNKNTYNIAVISMSLGTDPTYTPTTSPLYAEPALQAAYSQNIVSVASSGNEGSLTEISYPAVSPYVISVGSSYNSALGNLSFPVGNSTCNDDIISPDMISCFSNRAPFLDLVAPGAVIGSTTLSGGFGGTLGTSMSAPHVSGVIALMKQSNSQMTAEQIRNILKSTGTPIYDNATSLTFARLNALEAVRAVPYIKTTGTFYPGNTINIEISDPMNPGNLYFVLLSLGNSPGMPLPNGLVIPINPDFLFGFSIQPSQIFINNVGGLDSNGKATATLYLPNITGLETFTVHSSFITANSSLDIESIGNSIIL